MILLKEEVDVYIFKYKFVYSWYVVFFVKVYLGLSNFVWVKDMIDSLNDQEQQQGLFYFIIYYIFQVRYYFEFVDGGVVLLFVNQVLGWLDLILDD